MSAIGSLVFCTACGDLLNGSVGDPNTVLVCAVCGTENRDVPPKVITTNSKPSTFPSSLRAKRSEVQTLTEEDMQQEAMTQETCPNCGAKEMMFSAVQLRSADEGSTIFLRCKCGYRETKNN